MSSNILSLEEYLLNKHQCTNVLDAKISWINEHTKNARAASNSCTERAKKLRAAKKVETTVMFPRSIKLTVKDASLHSCYTFCDWLTVIIPHRHNKIISGGKKSFTDEQGNLEFESNRRKLVEQPSHSSKVSIRSINTLELAGQAEETEDFFFRTRHIANLSDKTKNKYDAIEISGNPCKWLSAVPVNLWHSQAIREKTNEFIFSILKEANIELNDYERKVVESHLYYPKRIDLTTNFKCKNQSDVARILQSLSKQSSSSYQQRHSVSEQTVYFGKMSKIKSLVFYNKFLEMKKNTKKKYIGYDKVLREAEDLLRYELRLKTSWFRNRRIYTLNDFFENEDYANIMENEMKQLKLGQFDVSDDELKKQTELLHKALEGQNIRNSVLNTFRAWQYGDDIKTLVSENTYYKHRKIILKITNLNIENIRDVDAKVGEVIPLFQYVYAMASSPSDEYRSIANF